MSDDRLERLAKWLNAVCCDWPAIGYDWNRRDRETMARKKDMRELARALIIELDRPVTSESTLPKEPKA